MSRASFNKLIACSIASPFPGVGLVTGAGVTGAGVTGAGVTGAGVTGVTGVEVPPPHTQHSSLGVPKPDTQHKSPQTSQPFASYHSQPSPNVSTKPGVSTQVPGGVGLGGVGVGLVPQCDVQDDVDDWEDRDGSDGKVKHDHNTPEQNENDAAVAGARIDEDGVLIPPSDVMRNLIES